MDLLEQWRGIYREVVRLSGAITELPDVCECGDAEGHLERTCRCCAKHEPSHAPSGHGETCTEMLARMRADVSLLYEDFASVGAPIEAVARSSHQVELRRGVFLTAGDLQQIVTRLERLSDAVVGFRRTCALEEMRSIKKCSASLREHCERLNSEIEAA